jgi:glucose-6-phosphate 1-dehydrogenase
VGVARTPMSDEQFREKLRESAREHASSFSESSWDRFGKQLHYHAGDAGQSEMYPGLTQRLAELGAELGINKPTGLPNLLFYLSVSPDLYEPIIARIGESGLVTEGKRWCSINPGQTPWQRIIVEKPFGTDLKSAVSLNKALGRVFEEDATFRIDHYLGKEQVQNILVTRFANTIFEPVWNSTYVDHVQVTAAETLGVGARAANFYDRVGALRDMVQSHLLQILALVAMEPPSVFDAAATMREKIKIFSSARIVDVGEATRVAALGRYGPGRSADGKPEPAYVDEPGVDRARKTESYAAMRVDFDNWRWAGVPFYLRSGKKLASKLTEVVVQFRRPPVDVFRKTGHGAGGLPGNRLVINIAPREGLALQVLGKVPGPGVHIQPASLELDNQEQFGGERVEAYGPLILDAMRGDRTLYKHKDEVEGSWRICQPLLDSRELRDSIQTYEPGTWGPAAADEMLRRDGRAWHYPSGERAPR